MDRRYYLHRISHEWSVSKALFDLGYLTTGWSKFNDSNIIDPVGKVDWSLFDKVFFEKYDKARGKNGLSRFLELKENDVIVVPLYDKDFAVVSIEVGDRVHQIKDLPENIAAQAGLKETTDIGFYIRFKKLNQIPRSYADKKLQSRMKVRQTNVDTFDLKDAIEKAIIADKPIDLMEEIHRNLSSGMLECIRSLGHDNMEELVKWYMLKKGATSAVKLPKNSSEKKEYEDADIRADFEDLNLVFYIQVKDHEGETSAWAVDQINKFKEMRAGTFEEDIVYVFWVISTADRYSDPAIGKARDNNIRLIDGPAFARMLLNVGIEDINKELKS